MNYSEIVEWLRKEYQGIRGGQANPAILDSVRVDMYGSQMPINQVSSILGESSRSLRITPWDKSAIKPIDTAIRMGNLGVSVSVDESGIRVTFPELTNDRRQILLKLAKQKLEEARIKIRTERQKILDDISKRALGEDGEMRAKNELQKQVDDANKKLEELYQNKESELVM